MGRRAKEKQVRSNSLIQPLPTTGSRDCRQKALSWSCEGEDCQLGGREQIEEKGWEFAKGARGDDCEEKLSVGEKKKGERANKGIVNEGSSEGRKGSRKK